MQPIPTEQQRPTPARPASVARMPGGKVRAALDLMVWEGIDRDAAAKQAGIEPKSLYNALRKHHVKAYYLGQCEVLRTSGRARRIHRLEAIAEQDDNKQAAVNAIKALDYIEDQPAAARGNSSSPGFVIQVINQPVQHTAHICENEAKPLIDHSSVRDQPAALPDQGGAHD